MYELKSKQAQLGPSILPQEPDSILWKHNGNKVVEFAGSEESVYGSYDGRIILNWHTAQLQISDLGLEDSGTYEYEIMTGGKLLVSSYELEVIGKSLRVFDVLLVFSVLLRFAARQASSITELLLIHQRALALIRL